MSKLTFIVVRTESCFLESGTKFCLKQQSVAFTLIELIGVVLMMGIVGCSVVGMVHVVQVVLVIVVVDQIIANTGSCRRVGVRRRTLMVVQIVRDVEQPDICIPRITCHRVVVD